MDAAAGPELPAVLRPLAGECELPARWTALYGRRHPAVLPREIASVFYTGWAHGDTEPNGTYVFKFTIDGILNGTPVTLTANSRPIVMTS